MKIHQQLLDAELKHHGQSRAVWLQQDENGVELVKVGDVGENALKILLILFHSSSVSNPRSINQFYHTIFLRDRKKISDRSLSGGLPCSKLFIVSFLPNFDLDYFPFIISVGKA